MLVQSMHNKSARAPIMLFIREEVVLLLLYPDVS